MRSGVIKTWPGGAPMMAMSELKATDLPAEAAGWVDFLNVLVAIYREKGTDAGITNAIRFFLGLEVAITAYAGEALILGESLLGQIERRLEEHALWAMGRIGARVPLYGSIDNVVPHGTVERWLERLLALPPEAGGDRGEFVLAAAEIGDGLHRAALLGEQPHAATVDGGGELDVETLFQRLEPA